MLRFLAIFFLLAALDCSPVRAQQEDLLTTEQLRELYGDPGDALEPAEVRALVLDLTNHVRRQNGLGTLRPLELADFMARRHASEMARLGYAAHLDRDGLNPVQRYNLLGGTDYVQENLIVLELDWPLATTESLVRTFQHHWLESPEHMRTMLSPQATHMGCAFELHSEDGLFRIAAVTEFISEHGDYSRLPRSIAAGHSLEFSGQLERGAWPGYIGIGLQPNPGRLSVEQLNNQPGHLSLPEESYTLPLDSEFADAAILPPDTWIEAPRGDSRSFAVGFSVPDDWRGQTVFIYMFAAPPGDDLLRCVACQAVAIDS